MTKQRIAVQRKHFPDETFEVDAYCVDDVFAAWVDEQGCVGMAGGDDGNWFALGGYHPYWIRWITDALQSAASDAAIAALPKPSRK